MTRMTKLIAPWVVLVAFAGAAFAQTAGEPAAPPAAAAPSGAPPTAAPPSGDASRKACVDAMNADPQFAASIVKAADGAAAARRDEDTLKAHTDADRRVQLNERHVIYSYAAMWIVAAAFVVFLWRRQQALKEEIAHLRRDLEAAADEAGAAKAGS